MTNELDRIIAHCQAVLDLNPQSADDDYGYAHLPLCVIDALFSIGVRYQSTQKVVERTCGYFHIDPGLAEPPFSMSQLLNAYDTHGLEFMTDTVFQNRQRTSTRSGILKSEAVYRFGRALADFQIDITPDLEPMMGDKGLEAAVRAIPGQRSGVSLRYFYMLTGVEGMIKPDRMILRFIAAAVGRTPSVDEAHDLIVAAAEQLAADYPHLTPRRLDQRIWQHQRMD